MQAADGGPIGLVEEGDLIEIDVLRGSLNLVGLRGVPCSGEEAAAALAARGRERPARQFHRQGALRYLDV